MNTYTEDEAKKKWCPSPKGHLCMASECMAWQYDEVKGVGDQPAGIAMKKGYCGLARKS